MTAADNRTENLAAPAEGGQVDDGYLDSALPDAILLEAWVRDQNHEALASLMRRYDPLVRKVCGHRCRSVADRDDAYQTTFLYLADRARTIRHPDRLPGWLHRVAQRSALAVLRGRLCDAMPDDVLDPSDHDSLADVSQRHDALVLDEALAEIPERYRTVLVLKHMQNESVAEIADRLECTEGTVRGRLQRGRALLSGLLRRRGLVPAVVIGAAMQSDAALADSPLYGPSELTNEFLNDFASGQVPPSPPVPLSAVSSLLKGSIAMSRFYLFVSVGVVGLAAAGLSTLGTADGPHSNGSGNREVLLVQTGTDPFGGNSDPFNSPPSDADPFAGNGPSNAPPGDSNPFGNARRLPKPLDPNTEQENKPQKNGMGNGLRSGGMDDGMNMGMDGGMDMGGGMDTGMGSDDMMSGGGMDMDMDMGLDTMMDMGGMGMGMGGPPSLSSQWGRFLDAPLAFGVKGQPAGEMIRNLGAYLGPNAPKSVAVDERALVYSQTDLSKKIDYRSEGKSARAVLKDLLSPLNLKAVVTNDGLLVTADLVKLTRQGIAADKWLNLDEEFAKKIEQALAQPVSVELIETPLNEAVQTLSQQLQIPLAINRMALEDMGLTPDDTVSINLKNVSGGSTLRLMLRDLNLTFTLGDEIVEVTTLETAEQNLASRLYWLEGIVSKTSGVIEVVQAIETTIQPDSWDVLGGPSAIQPISQGNRPAILVAATYITHRQIERYLTTIRDNALGDMDYVHEPEALKEWQAQRAAPRPAGGAGGGGGIF